MATNSSAHAIDKEAITLHPKRDIGYAMLTLFTIIWLLWWAASYFAKGTNAENEPMYNGEWITFLLGSFLYCSTIPLSFLAWTLCAFVRLDQSGVTWRMGWRAHYCRWEDVTDYHLIMGRRDRMSVTMATTDGHLLLSSRLWTVDVFKGYISRYARSSRTTDWREFGMRRDIDWPLTLDYDTPDSRFALRVLRPAIWIITVGLLMFLIDGGFTLYAKDGPAIFPIDLAMESVMLLIFGLPIWLLLLILPEFTARLKERIVISSGGLVYERPSSIIQASWQELRDLNPNGLANKKARTGHFYALETKDGVISFSHRIANATVLMRIIDEQLQIQGGSTAPPVP
jgi:hypothetical protein